MYAIIKSQNGADVIGLDVGDGPVTWSMFGGPELADLHHTLPMEQLSGFRLATVTIYGTLGPCWMGFVTAITPDTLHCSGPLYPLATVRRDWLFYDTRTSAWGPRTYQFATLKTDFFSYDTALRFFFDGAITNGWYTGAVYRFPDTRAKTVISFNWTRPDTDYRIDLNAGVWNPDATTGHETSNVWLYTGTDTYVVDSGSGALSGTFSKTIEAGNHDLLAIGAFYRGTTGTLTNERVTISNVVVRSERWYGSSGSVLTSTPMNIASCVIDTWQPDWAGFPLTALDNPSSTAIAPFVLEDSSGSDVLMEMLKRYPARLLWLRRGALMQPFIGDLSAAPVYYVNVNAADGFEPGGWDADEWANRAEVSYTSTSGARQVAAQTATSDMLARWGKTKTTHLSANTESATTAGAIAQIAANQAAAERYAGTLTTSTVLDAFGSFVPLDALECGATVKLMGLDNALSPRLAGYSLQGGRATLTLDTASGALDATLAKLEAGR